MSWTRLVSGARSPEEWEAVIGGQIRAKVLVQDQPVSAGALIEFLKNPERGPYPAFLAEIVAVWRMPLSDVRDSMMLDVGFKDFADFCGHVRQIYPQLQINTIVTIVKWNSGRVLNNAEEAHRYFDALRPCSECHERDQT